MWFQFVKACYFHSLKHDWDRSGLEKTHAQPVTLKDFYNK